VKDTYNNLVPNGAVLVYEGSTQIGTGIISNGITYIKLNLVSGTHLITVKYNGTTEYKPSNGTASITINKIDTSIDTIVTSNLIGNSSIKVTVKDTYNNLVPNGAVLVYESSKLIGQANISSGISNINLNLNTGSHTIKVTYNGTSKYNTSSRTTNIIVNKLNTQLNTIITHDTVGNSSIQVHVTDSNNNSVVNGLVLVYEGTTIIGQSNIENGVCDINLRLTSGSHTIKVKYEGTTKYIGSEGTLTINLNKIDTTLKTQIISSTVENTNIKVTVTDYNNNLVPSGVIFVYKGTTQIGTGIISNGVTNIKLNITSGTHDITVNYNGTSTYSKTSGKTSITVNKLSTSIDTSVTSSIIGNSSIRVTLKDENGNLVTGGMVTVYEKSNIIGTGTINNGISDINLNLNIGTHNITIKYGGSEIYNTIEGTTIITITNIPINKLNTNLNTELTNNVVSTSTIQVEIIDINGNPVTEGIVKVYEGLILIGQGSVSNGVSHILMDISSGTHTITVNYEGTEKYIGSSGNLDITIIKLDTIINTLIEHNTLNNTIIQVQVTDINSKLVSSGTVEVYENNTIVGSATISNGITNIKLNLGLGNHNITVNYTGTDKYGPSSGELSLKVTNTGIKSGVVNNTINNQIIQVNITDNNNNPINSGIIKIYENNNLISTVNVVNGVTNIKLNLTSGYHDLLINYDGNGKYNNATTNLQLTITIPTNINWLLTKNLQFNSNIEINITDINNHFVKEGKVQLLISGNNTKNIKVKNVTNGIVDIDLNDLLYGNYTIDIEYIGTTIYDSSTTSGSIYIYPSILMTTEVVQDTLGNSSIQVYLIYNGTQMVPYGNVNVYKLTSSIGAGSVNNGITGVISLNLTSPGIHKIKVTYPRTIYGSVEGVLNFNVNRISTGINTEILSNTVGNVTIKVTVKDVYYNKTGLNGTIKVFEGNTYRGSGTLVNGSAIIKIPGLTATNHTLKIEYSGNTEYLNSTGELNLTVEKISTGLTTSVLNSTIGSSRIQVIVNDLYNNKKVSVGNILVLENGKVIATGNITKGVSKINLDLTAGKHTLEIRYLGTGSYEQSNGTVNITIAKISTGITTVITNSSIRSSAIKVTVIDANKKLVPTGNVIVSESGKVITIGTISNGIVNIKLENLTARTHKLDILYNGTSTYAQSGGSINLTVTKLGTTLTTTIINDTIDGATIQIRITDMYGKNVTSGIVAVFENNKLLNQQKVTNGIITVALNNKLASGKHTINILYNETNVYLKSTGSINLTVYKLNTITSYIILHDTVKNNSLEIDVFDIYGRPVTNGILSITENGKIIAKTTITNGIYEIKLNLTKGTHYLNINYAGSDKYIASNNYLALNVTTKVETQISTTILNNTVNNATLKITVNGNSKPVTSGTITIYESGKIIGKGTLTNGTTTIKLNQKISGKHIITISYSGTMNIYSKTSSRIQINLEKLNTITKVNPIIGTSGSTVTFQANITDVLGKIVTEGRAIFKINGNTLKYSDGSTIYVNVKDGKAQLKYTLPSSWTKGTVTIQSVYGGSDTYNSSRSEKAAVKVNLRNATITIQQTITAKVGYNVTIQAIIKDTNTNQLLTGKVVFKINGITIKDANGTPIKVTVVNGKATLNYTIPTDFTGKKYKLTTIFDNPNYKLAKTNSILSIQKMTTHIQLNPTIVATTGKITTITGKILNEFNQTVPGTNKYVFKIDGKTLKDQKGNPIYYKATNGIINANITIPTEYKTGYHNLTIVTGERGGYTEARLTQQIYINSTTTQKTVIKV
ncbi:MAG: Ig-like domain-containing protein, partial [Methanobacteriaceae archaeon]|nr:Ig-like domain-containing protein [Methanobacteriaceae archaeon]